MTLKDYILAFLIMCIIDVIVMTILNLCGITVSCGAAFKRFLYKGGRTYFEQSFSDRAPDRMVDRRFHSYRYQIDAERNSSHSHYPANVVLRCEIPAGSRYYTEWGNGGGCLCSDFLHVTGWKKPGADEPWHDTPGPMCGRLRVRWVRIIYKLFSINKLE